MFPKRVFLFAVSAILAAILSVGCATKSASVTPPPRDEQSVRPGVNAEYIKPDLQVEQWVERFEREGREIYTKRH